MTQNKPIETCRVVICYNVSHNVNADIFKEIIKHTNAACVIFYESENDEAAFQKAAEPLVKIAQEQGAAALIAGDSRIAGRLKADGIHMIAKIHDFTDMVAHMNKQIIVGIGEIKDRHTAMEIGEKNPDYLMFGKLGADKTSSAHPRNLALGTWWAQMMEVPAIVQAGSTLESVEEAAASGAEFVALEEVLFGAADVLENAHKIDEIVKKHPLIEASLG